VDELAELRLDERPTGADRMPNVLGETGGAGLAAPDCVDKEKFDDGNEGEPKQQHAHKSEQDIGRGVEEARSRQSNDTSHLDRRRTFGNQISSNKGRLAHTPMLRPIRQL